MSLPTLTNGGLARRHEWVSLFSTLRPLARYHPLVSKLAYAFAIHTSLGVCWFAHNPCTLSEKRYNRSSRPKETNMNTICMTSRLNGHLGLVPCQVRLGVTVLLCALLVMDRGVEHSSPHLPADISQMLWEFRNGRIHRCPPGRRYARHHRKSNSTPELEGAGKIRRLQHRQRKEEYTRKWWRWHWRRL